VVEGVVEALARDPEAGMATAAIRCCARTYAHMLDEAAQGRTGGVSVVVDGRDHALYFSRRIVPFVPDDVEDAHRQVRLHLGLYAYRAQALAEYARGAPSVLEEMEGLEQLRCLDRGIGVRVVSFEPEAPMVELNNPQDVAVIEDLLVLRGVS
jgi:3-deoxy-manno-octulosonate cytidylyltransferase (CMP-KDO synthetase)